VSLASSAGAGPARSAAWRVDVRTPRSRLGLTRALDQRGGAEAFKDIDQQDFAAAGLHHLMANNAVAV